MYSVYVKRDSENPLETAEFVPDGFSVWAFVFNTLWALYHRIWWLGGVCFAFAIAVEWLEYSEFISPPVNGVLSIGFFSFVGMQAHVWYSEALEKRGYTLVSVVAAPNVSLAQQRFFDREMVRS